MHLDDQPLYLLLDRYLAGEASANDAEAVRQWLAEDREHAVLLEDLRLVRRIAAERPPASGVDAAWAGAVNALAVAPKPRASRWLLVTALAAAATVIALIGGATLLRRAPDWKERTTAAAQRAVVRLRDGTQLTLAPRSRVRYRADYGSTHRDVYLDGQAYFQVAKDERLPFRVHTAGSVTEDLGTAFLVNAYSDQTATEVVVSEGRVALRGADTTAASRTLVLGARDLGRLDASGVATLRRDVAVERYLAWTRGVLAFDAAPLADVARTLARWYNVDIRLADSALAQRRLTATFANEPIDLVVKRIALTLGMRVERDGSVFLLRPGLRARARH
ncbi:MAG TPA: FecR domain-containing protein [Gemmatimonadales bacterium]|jgi:transmembrane sensor|nr:FecR domain-containing protein [Gemmatimonadales bacterium]